MIKRKNQKRHKHTPAVLLLFLYVSSVVHGSYGVNNTDVRNVHHTTQHKKSALQRKKQLAVVGAAGIVYWACAGATNHAPYIPPQSQNGPVPFVPQAQSEPYLSPYIRDEYKIPCDFYARQDPSKSPIPRTSYDICNKDKKFSPEISMELQKAYAKGLVSALPEAITSIVEGYTPKLDEKRYNTIFHLIQAVSLETIQPYELIEPHGSGKFTGFFWLLDKYEKLKLRYAHKYAFRFPGQQDKRTLIINILEQEMKRLEQTEQQEKKNTKTIIGLDQ